MPAAASPAAAILDTLTPLTWVCHMLTRKHFKAFAAIIRDLKAEHAVRRELAEHLAALCRCNPRFNYESFITACGV